MYVGEKNLWTSKISEAMHFNRVSLLRFILRRMISNEYGEVEFSKVLPMKANFRANSKVRNR